MRIFGVTPVLIPTAITLVAVATATALGIWQIHRLYWKQGLIETRQTHSRLPVMTGAPANFDPKNHAFRRVRVTGRFDHGRELYVAARSLNGNLGFHIVTPFTLPDGRVLLVNRGWVPTELRDPALRAAGQADGPVSVTGFMRPAQKAAWFARDDKPAQNHWYTLDPTVMAAATKMARVLPWYLEADGTRNPGGFPLGGQTRLDIRNEHLQYIITWFAIAITGIVIWYLWHRRRERQLAAGDGPNGNARHD